MRWVERWFGVLAAGLALIALAFALSQHVTQVFTGSALYGSGYSATSALAAYLPLGLAVAAALLACFAAVRDSSLGARPQCLDHAACSGRAPLHRWGGRAGIQ